MKIGLLNGPNLNLLGTREPTLYGSVTLPEIEASLASVASELGATLMTAQANGEGQLIDVLHAWRGDVQGVVVNAGAFTHTSIALRDAFLATGLPFVEIHLTNIYAREPERRQSMLTSAAIGMVCGLGAQGYEFALRGLVSTLRAGRATP